LTFESTGDDALDSLLGGGIPSGSLTVVAGEPGSGKTIFTLQMLFQAARQGKKCLYFTTQSEPALKLVRYMQLFAFFDAELLGRQVQFVDLGAALRIGSEAVVATIAEQVEAFDANIVVIDSFRAINDCPPVVRRARVYDLVVQLGAWGTTAFLVGEYTPKDYSEFAEFAIADGIIRLGMEREELTSVREFEVLKLRGAAYVTGRHFCEITAKGFSIYPRVRAPDPERAERQFRLEDQLSTGVAGLDELLAGGLPRSTTTVLQGPTGAGKNILALQFLMAGAHRNEKGILFTLEETPEQLRAIAGAIGLDLANQEKKGLISICYCSPVELSTDRFLFDARNLVARSGARLAVFDSLTSMAMGVPSQRRFTEVVYSLAKHMQNAGTTVIMTMESEQLIGAGKLTGYGVSFLADALIQIRYVELEGALERAITVVKARGLKHLAGMRTLTIDRGAVSVTPGRLHKMTGILTGVPARAE